MNASMNIGEAAKASGVSTKMVRHYEAVGLLQAAGRSDSGYRQFSQSDVHTLTFIRRSRDLGFSIEEIRKLLTLWQDRGRPSREVKAMAQEHLRDLDRRLDELKSMRTALEHLMANCHGDDKPDCPILEKLSAGPGALEDVSPARCHAPSSFTKTPRRAVVTAATS